MASQKTVTIYNDYTGNMQDACTASCIVLHAHTHVVYADGILTFLEWHYFALSCSENDGTNLHHWVAHLVLVAQV